MFLGTLHDLLNEFSRTTTSKLKYKLIIDYYECIGECYNSLAGSYNLISNSYEYLLVLIIYEFCYTNTKPVNLKESLWIRASNLKLTTSWPLVMTRKTNPCM